MKKAKKTTQKKIAFFSWKGNAKTLKFLLSLKK